METSKTIGGLLKKTVGLRALRQYIEGDMFLEALMRKRAHGDVIEGEEEAKVKKRKKLPPGFAGITKSVTVASYHSEADAVRAIKRRIRWEKNHALFDGEAPIGFDRNFPRHILAADGRVRIAGPSKRPPMHPSYAADRRGNPRFPPSQRGLA